MHAIRTLIDKDGDWRIRAGVWNMLCHFFHDEWISDDEADDPGRVAPGFLPDDRAVIKFRKQHQSCVPHSFLDRAFQLSERVRSLC